MKAVLGNYYPPDAGDYTKPQTGLWCRRDSVHHPRRSEGRGARHEEVGVVGGPRIVRHLLQRRRDPEAPPELRHHRDRASSASRTPTSWRRSRTAAIDCGILLDPIWLQVKDDPGYFQAATQTPGEPLGMVAYGKSLLEDKPEVGVAFARAIIRTINTYLQRRLPQRPRGDGRDRQGHQPARHREPDQDPVAHHGLGDPRRTPRRGSRSCSSSSG